MPGYQEGMPPDMLSAQQGHQSAAAGLGQAAPAAAPPPMQQQPAAPAASQADLGSFAASALLAAERQQHVQRPQQPGAAQGAAALGLPQQQGRAQQAQRQEQGQAPEGLPDDVQHPLTVPVSAVAAGWAPDRSGRAPTGSGQCVHLPPGSLLPAGAALARGTSLPLALGSSFSAFLGWEVAACKQQTAVAALFIFDSRPELAEVPSGCASVLHPPSPQ